MWENLWQEIDALSQTSLFQGPHPVFPPGTVKSLTEDTVKKDIEEGIRAREAEANRVLGFKESAYPQTDGSCYTL